MEGHREGIQRRKWWRNIQESGHREIEDNIKINVEEIHFQVINLNELAQDRV
jgi:hypothetical protein